MCQLKRRFPFPECEIKPGNNTQGPPRPARQTGPGRCAAAAAVAGTRKRPRRAPARAPLILRACFHARWLDVRVAFSPRPLDFMGARHSKRALHRALAFALVCQITLVLVCVWGEDCAGFKQWRKVNSAITQVHAPFPLFARHCPSSNFYPCPTQPLLCAPTPLRAHASDRSELVDLCAWSLFRSEPVHLLLS